MMSDNNGPDNTEDAGNQTPDVNKKEMNNKEANAPEGVEDQKPTEVSAKESIEESKASVVVEKDVLETIDSKIEETPPEETITTEILTEGQNAEEPHSKEPAIESHNETDTNAKKETSGEDIEEMDVDDAEHFDGKDIDVESFDKKDFVELAEKMLDAMSKSSVSLNDIKNIDAVNKEIRASYDEIHGTEIDEAKKVYVVTNGSDEGFTFKNDNYDIRFESLMIQIREVRGAFFRKLEALKETYFERKTNLLQQLREIVDEEEKGGSKENWEAFKSVQNSWRDAGNVNSPHNGSLWSAYNALLDRYFDIRSIQNDLKELDRKKNLEAREAYVVKIEEIAASLAEQELTNSLLKKANEYLNDYKHTGPGPRKEQEILWVRMKAAFDIIYDKRRGQNDENQHLMDEVFGAKSSLVEKLKEYATFESDRINDWNAKTKEVQEIQNQWNNLKGPMPRDKAKDISKQFWKLLKDFFKGKSAFFNKLEGERKVNLTAKESLCKQVEEMVEANDVSADNTNRVIQLQKDWKTYGHVPQKFKDSIYKRFKKSCDSFFDLKRSESSDKDKEYLANLKAKEELCQLIESEVKDKKTDLSKLADYKKKFNDLGFVPRKDINSIQKRFIDAINTYVTSSADINKDEKEKLMLKNEVEVTMKSGGNPRELERQGNDLRRKLKTFEDEVTQLKTNIEFFGRSKGAEKIKQEYQKKIDKADFEAAKIKEKLKLIQQAMYS
ncbi:MAG: hypothetical protein ACI97P_000226 [Arcticibacterium sp.]|jgi:hypothetical protein